MSKYKSIEAHLKSGKAVTLVAGCLRIDQLGEQELPELGSLQTERDTERLINSLSFPREIPARSSVCVCVSVCVCSYKSLSVQPTLVMYYTAGREGKTRSTGRI